MARSLPLRVPARALLGLGLAGVLLLGAGCATSDARGTDEGLDGRPGLHLTGIVDGRQVAVSAGAPELVVGDCDPTSPPDQDVCAVASTIGGDVFVLSFENPAVLESDTELEVEGSTCDGPACDDIDEHAIVDVQVGGDDRIRARGGEVRVDTVEDFRRYAGRVRLELPGDGTLSGTFDLVPRPD